MDDSQDQEVLLRPLREPNWWDRPEQRRHHELPLQPEALGAEDRDGREIEVRENYLFVAR